MKVTHVCAWVHDRRVLFSLYTQKSQELSGYDPSWEIHFALIYLYLSKEFPLVTEGNVEKKKRRGEESFFEKGFEF